MLRTTETRHAQNNRNTRHALPLGSETRVMAHALHSHRRRNTRHAQNNRNTRHARGRRPREVHRTQPNDFIGRRSVWLRRTTTCRVANVEYTRTR
jgi:hypothetical protein